MIGNTQEQKFEAVKFKFILRIFQTEGKNIDVKLHFSSHFLHLYMTLIDLIAPIMLHANFS